MRIAFSFAAALVVAGCSATAHLYPTNEIAQQTGVIEADFTRYGTGHVTVTAAMPDGEELAGEATVVTGGSISFGTIFASVYGTGGSAYGTGTSLGYAVPGGSPGMASLYGNHGTSIQC
jgi:hypothetical protein